MKSSVLYFSIILFLLPLTFQAQNLVLNPGLEKYISCPGFGQFGNAWINDWYKPSVGSSDYYRYNCPGIAPSAQAPHNDSAEAGVILFNYGTEYREYITAGLSQPLVAGKSYYVEFYLDLNPGYIQAVKEAGAYLSDSVPGFFSNSLTINVNPQIKNTNGFLSYGWTKISGSFIANGGESYITLGNFNNDSNTTTSMVGSVGSYGSYYFVDDVYVGAEDSVPSGLYENEEQTFNLFPNPIHLGEPLTITTSVNEPMELDLYDVTGRACHSFEINKKSTAIGLEGFSPGFYTYLLKTKSRFVAKGKIIVA